ncbi:hypothetical protein ZIOFF_018590 [Zingiber officinale]|uniref:TRF2/HOY1 PH-like domain-containing protein n=1 Tax=Zingiber officinale TaxID=94328 RepID=A0A8J5H6I7_ZINOF|nr:hypothetical protein ZIOFF_018590 [Zingiber officinale]
MVWSSDSGKRQVNSTPHSAPPPPAVKLEVEEPLDKKRVRLHKRARDASTSCEQVDPSLSLLIMFVSLSPMKSPSLADMIQMMLSQAKAGKTLCFTSSKGSKVGEQSDFSASSSSLSKIKTSNFLASLLRIGTWECVSRYEGDLVAKCYFAKHKIVWEVLKGGLKSKIEFHWSNIIAIKAVFFEGGHGSLDIVKVALQKLASVEGSVVLCLACIVVSNIDAGIDNNIVFRGQRIFLPNASGWFGDAPLEASSDFGINPENGEFHLMCQITDAEWGLEHQGKNPDLATISGGG